MKQVRTREGMWRLRAHTLLAGLQADRRCNLHHLADRRPTRATRTRTAQRTSMPSCGTSRPYRQGAESWFREWRARKRRSQGLDALDAWPGSLADPKSSRGTQGINTGGKYDLKSTTRTKTRTKTGTTGGSSDKGAFGTSLSSLGSALSSLETAMGMPHDAIAGHAIHARSCDGMGRGSEGHLGARALSPAASPRPPHGGQGRGSEGPRGA